MRQTLRMELGLHLGYWMAQPPAGVPAQIAEAENLGFDSIWTAEAYGSDVLTPLAWWGASTSRLRLGTDLMQLSARTPTAAAMAALTMDHLSGGRFVLGLGLSGPQGVEGWYGQSFAKPLARTREYVGIIRKVLAREGPVTFEGEHYPLPRPGGTGLGKALKSTVHPLRADLPIVLGAEGPKNVALAAEIADGWFPIYYSPKKDAELYAPSLDEGFARPGARRTAEDFEVIAMVPVVVHDDVEVAADSMRSTLALYVGGMGAREANFHFDVFCRMGYEAEATKIQDLYLEGRKDEAAAVVPTAMVEEIALVGPRDKISDDLEVWKASRVTTMLVNGSPQVLQMMAELVL